MSTASTKSRHRKQQRRSEKATYKAKGGQATPPPTESSTPELSDRAWLIASLSILAVAAVLRLYHLAVVPFHHDEGVNGNFLVRLVREGVYHYDPSNYHGPTLYYFSAVTAWILRFFFGASAQNAYGLNTVTVRLVPALFGLATVWLVLMLRRRLGSVGALCAAALLAVSPGAVYLSRYFIHETLFVFFTLGIVVAGLKFYEEKHPIYLVLASVSAALLFGTKETFIINAPVLLLALLSAQIYGWLIGSFATRQRKQRKKKGGQVESGVRDFIRELGGPSRLAIWGLLALVVFAAVSILFYSSFFTNFPKGVYDSLKTFQVWTKTGLQAHVHPRWKYIEWLGLQESPILVLGTIGSAVALLRPKNKFAVFAAFWAFGTLAAYSLVPYKTPWLTLNFIVPMALVAGWAFQSAFDLFSKHSLIFVASAVLLLAVSVSTYQAIDLNFYNYDNDEKTVDLGFFKSDFKSQYYVYVYAHTHRELLVLLDEIDRLAEVSGERNTMGITIVSPDYWPLPWYLRDYTRVGYHGRMTTTTEPVIIAGEGQGAEVEAMFGDRYVLVNSRFNPAGSYRLRPGVSLLLFARRDVMERRR